MSEQFTLVSWNIFQGLHHASTRRRWVTNAQIDDHLGALDADVLVLPEAWRYNETEATWAEEIASAHGYELHQWVSDRPSRTREKVPWRMVILTKVPCRRLEDHVMPQLDPFGQRAFVRIELESGVTIAGAHTYGIHLLAHGRPFGWQRERKELTKLAATVDVVAGDMNMWGPIVHRDMANLRPAVTGRTFSAPRPHSQIDHVMVSDRIEVISGGLLPDMGSDHLGLRATLALR